MAKASQLKAKENLTRDAWARDSKQLRKEKVQLPTRKQQRVPLGIVSGNNQAKSGFEFPVLSAGEKPVSATVKAMVLESDQIAQSRNSSNLFYLKHFDINYRALSETFTVFSFDFNSADEVELSNSLSCYIESIAGGRIDAISLWWEIETEDGTKYNWYRPITVLSKPISISAGQKIEIAAEYNSTKLKVSKISPFKNKKELFFY